MPGEEGYPAYLSSRLAEFYERAGIVRTLGKDGRVGSVTAIGAVSPAGGDLSEPVSQATLRIVKVFWGLSANLAYKRHFPAIDWLVSYSLYADRLSDWYTLHASNDFIKLRAFAMHVLQEEAELDEIVRLIGADSLSGRDRMTMETAKIIREDFLHQNAFHETDTYTSIAKQCKMLRLIYDFNRLGLEAVEKGARLDDVLELPVREKIGRAKYIEEKDLARFDEISKEMNEAMHGSAEGTMFKEYKTIKEVVGPLLLVEGVEGVKYNELVEIVQKDGEVRHGKVLEVHRDKALVQLFESSQGLQISTSRAKFLGRSLELSVSEDMLGRVFDGMGRPARRERARHRRQAHGRERGTAQSRGARLSQRVYPDGRFRHRRTEYARARTETARVQHERSARTQNLRRRSRGRLAC